MKEIPILYNTPMVQALLGKRKTQTRRIMKPQIKDCDHSRYTEAEWKDKPTEWSEASLKIGRAYCGMCGNGVEYSKDYGGIKCPYGQPGDLLYVRETWFPAAITGNEVMVGYHGQDPTHTHEFTTDNIDFYWKQMDKGHMIPSIHMPKEAARIWLQVESIRVERLQDISEEDAQAEGVKTTETQLGESYFDYTTGYFNGLLSAKDSFRTLWKSINGPESWQANPWVWCISFKVLSTTGHP